jgi:hypothetical protein
MKRFRLWIGDLLAWFVLTLLGFASHGELSFSAAPRMLATFIPLLVAWYPLALLLDLLARPRFSLAYLLRLNLAIIYTVSLAVLLRAAWLRSAVPPIFAFVLSLTSMAGITFWRFLYVVFTRRSSS